MPKATKPTKPTKPTPDVEPTPEPEDLSEINLEGPIDPTVIIDNAKKTFHVGDRLKGITHRHGRIAIFTDLEAVDAYREVNAKAQALNDAAGKTDLKKPGGPERSALLVEEYTKLEPEVEAARMKMLEGALFFYLHAWPNVAAKVARRDARKKYHDDAFGGVPPHRAEEASNYVDMQLFGASIRKIVDGQGNEDHLEPYNEVVTDDDGNPVFKKDGVTPKTRRVNPRATIGEQLSNDLGPSQWQRLYDAYQKLTLTDQIAQAATDDPGF